MVDAVTLGADGVWDAHGKDDNYTSNTMIKRYPEDNDKKLFEKICLEGFQAGLADNYSSQARTFSRSFSSFDFNKISRYGKRKSKHLK